MNDILYRPVDYAAPDDRKQILRLYRDIFHIDFAKGYDMWFLVQERKPLGAAALDQTSGKMVGHWACVRLDAFISGRRTPFRLSLGTMTVPEYQGKGIATNLFRNLYDAIIRANDARFFMGYPNEVSYTLLVGRLGFVPLRDYNFVVLPKGPHGPYTLTENLSFEENTGASSEQNCLIHSAAYMSCRYADKRYEKWRSGSGHIFISTRFMDKADILYWSKDAGEEELLDFAAFLYEKQGVERVTTWNTVPFLDAFPREDRNYHMCIHYLNCPPAEKADIQKDWFFCMGDCELF